MITFFQRWVLASVLLLGCGGEGPSEGAAAAETVARLQPLPEPDLSAADAELRDRVAELESGIEQLEAAKPVDPAALGSAQGALGQLYTAHHFVDAAVVCLGNAETLAPGDPRWPYLLGFLYQISGQMEEASQAFGRVLALGEADQGARLRLAAIYLELDQVERARPLLEQVMASDPSSAAALDGMGKIALAAKDLERAVDLFERALAAQPEASSVHYSLAQAYRKLGDLDRAKEHLKRSGEVPLLFPEPVLRELARFGATTGFYRLRAERAFQRGNFAVAAENYRELVAREPNGFDDRKRLAYALHRTGDLRGSVEQLEASLQIRDPAITGEDLDQLRRIIAGLQAQLGADPQAIDDLRRAAGTDLRHALEGPRWAGALRQVPAPDLRREEDATRRRIDALLARARSVASSPGARRAEVAGAFGDLGRHYAALGFLEAAEACFDNAAAAEPEKFRWAYLLAVTRQDSGDALAAAKAFERAQELRPDDLPTLLHLAESKLELDQAAAARRLFRRVFDQDPDSAAAHYGLGRVALLQRDHALAVEHLEKALVEQPEATLVHYSLAQAYRHLGDLEKSRRHLELRGEERVRFDDPLAREVGDLVTLTSFEVVQSLVLQDDFSPVNDLGYALARLGNVEGAVEELERLLWVDAPDAPAADPRVEARLRFIIGGLWVHRQADDRAEAHFRRAVERDPTLVEAQIKLANVLARSGRLQPAIEHYSQALAMEPDHAAALFKRATARTGLGLDREALRDLERLVELETSAASRIALAAAHEGLGDLAAAAAAYRAALELDLPAPERARIHTALGHGERRRGRFEPAVEQYRAALRLAPGAVDARLQLAAVLGHLGRLEESASAYREVLSVEPDHVAAWRGQTAALVLQSRYREAQAQLEQARVRFPGEASFTHALARLLAASPEASLRDGARALELAEQAFREQATLQRAETLAMSYAAAGRFREAVQVQRDLIAQAESRRLTEALPELNRQLSVYEKRGVWQAPRPEDLIVRPPSGGAAAAGGG